MTLASVPSPCCCTMTHDGAIKFKEVAERLSGGKLEVQVFGGAQLGGERDLLEGIRLGTVYMAVGTGALANFAPAYNVVQLPILIKNQEHMTKIAEGPAGKAARSAHRGAGRSPLLETPTHWIAHGFDEDLNRAMTAAARALLGFLVEHRGLSRDDSYSLMSVAADFSVTQVVDQRQGVHGMIAKSLFIPSPT